MATLALLFLSAALLTAAPDPSDTEDSPNLTQVQAFTIVANVLGAATACDGIAHDRVSAVARQVGAAATSRVVSPEELTGIERVLMTSAVAGRKAVEEGMTDCNAVEAAFSNVEQTVLQTPV